MCKQLFLVLKGVLIYSNNIFLGCLLSGRNCSCWGKFTEQNRSSPFTSFGRSEGRGNELRERLREKYSTGERKSKTSENDCLPCLRTVSITEVRVVGNEARKVA